MATASSVGAASRPLPCYSSIEEAVAAARELAPRLRDRVPLAEQLRRLPDETVEDLLQSRLISLMVPRRFGGSELNYDAVLEVCAVLAEACSATGWVYALWTAHTWLIAEFPEHIQHLVFDDPRSLVSSVVSTVGEPVAVDGGYRWTGRGHYSSGVDHCTWMSPLLALPQPDGTMQRSWLLMPRSDIEIVDDWHVMGLKGTGSKTIVVDDVFIPHERILSISDMSQGLAPGARVNPGPLYQAAFDFTFSLPLALPSVGVARAFLGVFTERLRNRLESGNEMQKADALHVLPRLAQATADVDCAHAVLLTAAERYCTAPASQFTAEDKLRGRRDTAYAAQLCRRAVNSLFEGSSASAIYDNSELQRLWRDTNAATAHHGLNWDSRGSEFGRAMVGLTTSSMG